jgi:hypothetical protein
MMDIDQHDDCHGIDDEMQDQDDELRKFVNQHVKKIVVLIIIFFRLALTLLSTPRKKHTLTQTFSVMLWRNL